MNLEKKIIILDFMRKTQQKRGKNLTLLIFRTTKLSM